MVTIENKYALLSKKRIDFTRGSFQDISPVAASCTPTIYDGHWVNNKRGFCITSSGVFNYGNAGDFDNDEVQTFIAIIKTEDTSGTIASKSLGSSTFEGWNLYLVNGTPTVRIYENGTSSGIRIASDTRVDDGKIHHVVLTYDGSGDANGWDFYVDGIMTGKAVQVDAGFTTSTLTSADYTVCSVSYAGGPLTGCIYYFDQLAIELTSAEVAQSYTEWLQKAQWTLKTIKHLADSDGTVYDTYINNGEGWNESISNETTGRLSNTDWNITSGTWKIESDDELPKYISCKGFGIIYTDQKVGYGTWRFTFNKAAGSGFYLYFMYDNPSIASGNGYYFYSGGDENFILFRDDAGSGNGLFASATGAYTAGTDVTVEITRSKSDNKFYIYTVAEDDTKTLIPASAGANPTAADSTHTNSIHMVADLDTGDKIKNFKIISE